MYFMYESMPLDIFSLQGKSRNHRYIFGHGAVEKYLGAYYILFGV